MTNKEAYERAAEAWNRGDVEPWRDMHDPDVVLEDELFPDGGTHEGVDAVWRRYDELVGLGGVWSFETMDLIETGDQVVWTGHIQGRRSEDDPPYELRDTGSLFTFRDGKVVRIQWFPTADGAREAAGLPPP